MAPNGSHMVVPISIDPEEKTVTSRNCKSPRLFEILEQFSKNELQVPDEFKGPMTANEE
jgi:hypothetical protein